DALSGDWMLVVLSHQGRETIDHGKNTPPAPAGQGRSALRPPTVASIERYSDDAAVALESAFQMNGSVAHDWPRCCGLKPNRTMRPFPTLTSASAICPRSLSSPSSQPLNSTFSFAYRAMTRTFASAAAVNAELLMKYAGSDSGNS